MKKIFHIASFKGNAGDIVNHNGFYKTLRLVLGEPFEVTQVEIREFYRNCLIRRFDKQLLSQINEHDIFVLGGGAFFDVRWHESETGTTLDMGREFIDGIRIPTIVNAMGYLELADLPKEYLLIFEKFEQFLAVIAEKDNWLITVRNDCSLELMQKRFAQNITSNIIKVADNGFFYTETQPTKRPKEPKTIGLNLTNDLFSHNFNRDIDVDTFNNEIARHLDALCENHRLILFAHTPQDIQTIHTMMQKLGGAKFRDRISVAPYFPSSDFGIDELARYYQLCDYVVAMRFHANILCLQLGVPVVGLAGHRQIDNLYKELGLQNYLVKVDHVNFIETLYEKEACILSEVYPKEISATFDMLNNMNATYLIKLTEFLNR